MRAFVLALVLALGSLTAVALMPGTARADDFYGRAAAVQPVFWHGHWGGRYWGGYPGYYYGYGYPGYYSGYSYPYYSYPWYGSSYYNPGNYYYYYWGY
jgi:hypothetical protein